MNTPCFRASHKRIGLVHISPEGEAFGPLRMIHQHEGWEVWAIVEGNGRTVGARLDVAASEIQCDNLVCSVTLADSVLWMHNRRTGEGVSWLHLLGFKPKLVRFPELVTAEVL